MQEVKVTSPKAGKSVEFQINLGENLSEAVALFGEEVIFSKFAAQCRTDAGNAARAALNGYVKKDGTVVEGDEPEKVVADMASWKPSLQRAGADPVAAIAKKLEGKTPEEKQALIEALIAKLSG